MPSLIIGEAPSREMEASGKLEPLMRPDLAKLAGLGYPNEWVQTFDRYNLLDYWPGSSGKGSRFPAATAASAAFKLAPMLHHFDRVVLLGRRVAKAFAVDAPWFCWFDRFGTRMAVAPHPSKVSHWWNDASNVAAARRFWSDLARESLRGQPQAGVEADVRRAVP